MRVEKWDILMHRLLTEKKEKEAKASKSKGSKPDYLDLDKDGDTSEPMKKAAKESGDKKETKPKKGKGKIPAQLKMHIKKKKSKLDEAIESLEKILLEQEDSSSELLMSLKNRLKTMDGSDESGYGSWGSTDTDQWSYDDAEGGYYNELEVDFSNPTKIKVYGSNSGQSDEKTFSLNSENDVDYIIEFAEEVSGLREGSGDSSDKYEEEDEEYEEDFMEEGVEYLSEAEVKKKNPPLGKVTRNPSGSKKKFHVYVKCGGKVKKISFGDPGLSIKRDSAARRKNFRARHKCDKPAGKDRCTARYWSCYQWRAGKKVEGE